MRHRDEGMNDMIVKAKEYLARKWGIEDENRRWIESIPNDYYSASVYRVRTLIWVGTPAKGIIIADYGRRRVYAIDTQGIVKKYKE